MKFPVIIIKDRDPIIYVYENLTTLKQTSEELLNKGIWNGCKMIDSNGDEFDILEVKKTGLRGLWGWSPLLKGKSIWIDFKFSNPSEMELEKFKEILISKIDKKRSFWENASWDIGDLKSRISSRNSIGDIIKLFI